MTNQGEMSTCTARVPATARKQKPKEITIQSRIITCFKTNEYRSISTKDFVHKNSGNETAVHDGDMTVMPTKSAVQQ